MSITPKFIVAPPLTNDFKTFKDYTSVIQNSLSQLFQNAHIHQLLTSAPTTDEGNLGDIKLVNLSGVPYLYIKFPSPLNWKRVVLS